MALRDEKMFTLVDVGNVTEAYQQLAANVVFQAAKDYVHYVNRKDYTDEMHIAEKIFDESKTAWDIVRKRLKRDPNSVDECKAFLLKVIECATEMTVNRPWWHNMERAREATEKADSVETMWQAALQYLTACKFYRQTMIGLVDKRNSDIRSCRRFLTNGSVEFYTNGRIESESLMALLEEKVREKKGETHGRPHDLQGDSRPC